MRFKRVEIDNFLVIEKLHIDLSEQVHFFFGENRAGKSSIAHAIAFPFLGVIPDRGVLQKKQIRFIIS